MCLVVLAFRQHPEYPLIVAANRDEFHQRPSREIHWWPDESDIVGGRDLQAGGTWLALHRSGRFAAVTNFRDADVPVSRLRSRGHLITDFLLGNDKSLDYLNTLEDAAYAGFNLLVFDGKTLAWKSNRSDGARVLPPGTYGLSNALLDSPWHKVVRSKAALQQLILEDKVNETELLRLLDDREKAPVGQIADDRLPFETAHAISAGFIVLPDYGTRSSSVVLCHATGRWQIRERRFDAAGNTSGDTSFAFAAGVQA
jgi:uncharacterized protein with NRDE domain